MYSSFPMARNRIRPLQDAWTTSALSTFHDNHRKVNFQKYFDISVAFWGSLERSTIYKEEKRNVSCHRSCMGRRSLDEARLSDEDIHSIHKFIYIYIYIYMYTYLYITIYLYLYLSIYLSICLSVYLSINISIYIYKTQVSHLFTTYIYIYIYIYV